MTLFIFNPETDFALGARSANYTPPKAIIKTRIDNILIPAVFAKPGDCILLLDDISEEEIKLKHYYDLVLEKNLNLVRIRDLRLYIKEFDCIKPWGWNPSLKAFLMAEDIPERLMPSDDDLKILKKISHRNTTVSFLKEIIALKSTLSIPLPKELTSIEEVEKFIDTNKRVFLKAPWSGAGRGIATSRRRNKRLLLEWAKGTIRKQGSVIAEVEYDRALDFASEWIIEKGEAEFLGLSLFQSSPDGRYHGNFSFKQYEIEKKIKEKTSLFSEDFLVLQKQIINKLISPFYSGPLGIDMLADEAGRLNPCVEINFRYTMGHVNLFLKKLKNGI